MNRYYMTMPAKPPGCVRSKVWDKPGKISGSRIIGRGWAEYREPLSFEQIRSYSLLPADRTERHAYAQWCGTIRTERRTHG